MLTPDFVMPAEQVEPPARARRRRASLPRSRTRGSSGTTRCWSASGPPGDGCWSPRSWGCCSAPPGSPRCSRPTGRRRMRGSRAWVRPRSATSTRSPTATPSSRPRSRRVDGEAAPRGGAGGGRADHRRRGRVRAGGPRGGQRRGALPGRLRARAADPRRGTGGRRLAADDLARGAGRRARARRLRRRAHRRGRAAPVARGAAVPGQVPRSTRSRVGCCTPAARASRSTATPTSPTELYSSVEPSERLAQRGGRRRGVARRVVPALPACPIDKYTVTATSARGTGDPAHPARRLDRPRAGPRAGRGGWRPQAGAAAAGRGRWGRRARRLGVRRGRPTARRSPALPLVNSATGRAAVTA